MRAAVPRILKIRRVVPLVLATLLAVASAAAHETPKSSDIAVTLKPISRDLVGVRVQIVNSVAYQLVVENQSRKELEILDAKDRPFLRIGPGGALGEIASRGGETKWKSLNSQPSWGWIDPRLSTDEIKVTEAVRERDRESRVGSWKIPVRFDG